MPLEYWLRNQEKEIFVQNHGGGTLEITVVAHHLSIIFYFFIF